MGPISCVIPYYIEIKESLYLGKFFSNFFENWYKMRKNTIILFFCKLFWGRCWNGDPLWGHFPEFFKAINYDQITIESSKLGTLYIFWGEKFDLQSFWQSFWRHKVKIWAKRGHICSLYSNRDRKIKFNICGFFENSNSFLRPVF